MSMQQSDKGKIPSKRARPMPLHASAEQGEVEAASQGLTAVRALLFECRWCDNKFSSDVRLATCTVCGGPVDEVVDREAFFAKHPEMVSLASLTGTHQLCHGEDPFNEEI